jgi:hypothetical protein
MIRFLIIVFMMYQRTFVISLKMPYSNFNLQLLIMTHIQFKYVEKDFNN